MEIDIQTVDQVTVIRMVGEIDGKTASCAGERISAQIHPGVRMLLDMSEVVYMSSAGLRVMLASGQVLEIPRGRYFASPAGTFEIISAGGERTRLRIPDYPMPRTKNTAGIFCAPHMDRTCMPVLMARSIWWRKAATSIITACTCGSGMPPVTGRSMLTWRKCS